jgi:hypothetical protein
LEGEAWPRVATLKNLFATVDVASRYQFKTSHSDWMIMFCGDQRE